MKAFKLLKKRKDGTLGPLFINASQRIPLDEWLDAEDHPTNGFAHRPGWHCTVNRYAPHLKMRLKSGQQRVWCLVELEGKVESYRRSMQQGGIWLLAERMRVLHVIE